MSIKHGLASCMDIDQKWKIKNLSIYNTSMVMCEFLLTDLTCTVLLPYPYWFILRSIKFSDFQFNPLSLNGDQHQFSCDNIHTLSREKVMRINKMITKKKCLDLLSNSLNTVFKKMYSNQFGEFVFRYWGLKR